MKIFERVYRIFKKKPIRPNLIVYTDNNLIGFCVHYVPYKIQSVQKIQNLQNEIIKSGIWCELITENMSPNAYSVRFKKEDKYTANTCYRDVFGDDILEFTDEERRIIKNKIRKEKIRKIEDERITE